MAEMAESLDVPVSKVKARVQELAEFNPMLGNRGCRIGIAYPEIYQMQARAIFEAACEAAAHTGQPVRPEIMIPLVSAVRELELLKRHIDAVASEVRAEVEAEQGEMVDYHVGVMIETPRAALRADDIADEADFLSFGTNDLTQMVYGLSRDDAGRFIIWKGWARSCGSPPSARGRTARRSRSGCAASMAAIRNRCNSARSPASIMSRVRPFGCRSHGWRRRRRRSGRAETGLRGEPVR
jgi:phosphoenolpyruvate synthase/pyruvate phosphate dikinase